MRKEQIAQEMGYSVSDKGDCINPEGEVIAKRHVRYRKFKIRVDKKIVYVRVHRLQAYQKYGNKIYQEGIDVRHLDNNKMNCAANNIAIGTRTDNMLDIPLEIRRKRMSYIRSFRYQEKIVNS